MERGMSLLRGTHHDQSRRPSGGRQCNQNTGCIQRPAPTVLVYRGQKVARIYASSQGSTIDAIGDGRYLVCNAAYCVMVLCLPKAHDTLKRQETPLH